MVENTETSSAEKRYIFSLKEIITTGWFILILGITIGGYVKILNEVEDIGKQVQSMANDISFIKGQNSKIVDSIKQ